MDYVEYANWTDSKMKLRGFDTARTKSYRDGEQQLVGSNPILVLQHREI